MRNYYSTFLFTAVLLLSAITAFPQKTVKVTPKNALSYIYDGNWEKAKQMYLQLLKDTPDDESLNLYCGVAYLNSRINGDKSLDYFNKVNPETTPGVLLLKGEAFHYIGEFDSAKVYYAKYRDTDGVKIQKGLYSLMEVRIEQCNLGETLSATPAAGMFVENLGTDVNTVFLDYAPVVYEDLKTLVFTSTNANLFNIEYMTFQEKGQEEIFYTNYDPVYKKWLPRSKADSVVLNKNIDSEYNESSITFSKDLSKFYFFRLGELFVSTNLSDPVNTEIKPTGFNSKNILEMAINRNEDHVFITSDKKGGKGGTDIYMSVKDENGDWGEFVNMEDINTEENETSPFINGDASKFYFASRGHNSIGDYDIFVASKSDSGWANIQNMGVPLNSPANDIHFRLTGGNEEFGYLASDRMGGQGDYDVWRFWTCHDIPNTNLLGKFTVIGGNIDSATITLMNLDSSTVKSTNAMANNGEYSFPINTETPYILELDVKGHAIQYFNLSIPELCSQYDIFQNLTAELKMDADSFVFEQMAVLTNAFYDINTDKGDLTNEAYVASLTPEMPNYTDPETKVTTFEKDELLASLGKDAVVNADGKSIYEVYFDFDKKNVIDSDKDFLINLAKGLKSNPKASIVIAGHTDSQGASGYNKWLSRMRAKSVAKILIDNGVNPNQIVTEGYGESQLKIKDTLDNGGFVVRWGKINRRCEIEIK